MIDVKQRLDLPSGTSGTYFSLPLLEERGLGKIARLPVSLRIVLESVVRHLDGRTIDDTHVEALARWQPDAERFDLQLPAGVAPRQPVTLHIHRNDGRREAVDLRLRIDTPIEATYFAAGGILPHVFEQLQVDA